jgi:hypothetical protein
MSGVHPVSDCVAGAQLLLEPPSARNGMQDRSARGS